MTRPDLFQPDPQLDLVLERIVDVAPELVWKAWTTPEHVKRWFTPAPWTTVDCEIDVRPGGAFRTVMRSPEGQEFPHVGCYLELVPNCRLVWTTALLPGYRPTPGSTTPAGADEVGGFTAVITMEPHGTGTRYVATAIHRSEAERKTHEKMGFHHGWGAARDQLVALARTM